jgi:hypothetical protein
MQMCGLTLENPLKITGKRPWFSIHYSPEQAASMMGLLLYESFDHVPRYAKRSIPNQ